MQAIAAASRDGLSTHLQTAEAIFQHTGMIDLATFKPRTDWQVRKTRHLRVQLLCARGCVGAAGLRPDAPAPPQVSSYDAFLTCLQAFVLEDGASIAGLDCETGQLERLQQHTLLSGSVVWDLAVYDFVDGEFKEHQHLHKNPA